MARKRLGRITGVGPVRSWLLWHVAFADVRRLARDGDVSALLARLYAPREASVDGGSDERVGVITALGFLRARDAVPRLAPFLDSDEPTWLRMCATEALGRIGGDDALNALVRALGDEAVFVRNTAVKAFAASPKENVLPALAALATSDAHRMVRCNALEALGNGRDDRWMSVLEAGARDRNFLVRVGAQNGLFSMKTDAGLDAVLNITRERTGPLGTALMRASIWQRRLRRRRKTRKRLADTGAS